MLKNFETAVSQLINGVDWKKPKFDGFRSDPYVAKVAVVMSPTNIEHVATELLDDKGFMLSCIKSSTPSLLNYASERLKDDPEIILAALEESKSEELALKNIGPTLQKLTSGKPNLLDVVRTIKQHKLVDIVHMEDKKGEGRPKVHRKIGDFSFCL